jgi:hypothetical protein
VSDESVRLNRQHRSVRTCGRCGVRKPASDFAHRRKALGQLDNYCRVCRAEYKQAHYAANRRRYIEMAQARKRRLARERATLLLDFFGSHPFADCGERDPVVLEFDHLDDKSFGISKGLRDHSWDAVLD